MRTRVTLVSKFLKLHILNSTNCKVFLITALAVSSLLKADLQPLSLKTTTLPLQSPTFPIPGSASEPTPRITSPDMPTQSAYLQQSTAPLSPVNKSELKEVAVSDSNPVMYYTPDEEEAPGPSVEEGKLMDKPETTSYVPPFNNPLYPNSSYTSYGSVIGNEPKYITHSNLVNKRFLIP